MHQNFSELKNNIISTLALKMNDDGWKLFDGVP